MQNWKQQGAKLETAGCRIGNSKAHNLQYLSLPHLFLPDSRSPVGFLLDSYWISTNFLKRHFHIFFHFPSYWTPVCLWSLLEIPSNGLPNFISKSAESTWTPHSVCKKCGVQMHSPLCRVQPKSQFPKTRSPLELPTLFLQIVESAWTVHCVVVNCGVYTNSPLCVVCLKSPFCFSIMQSSKKLPTLVFKNAEFVSTPHLFLQNAEFAWTLHWVF